MLPDNNNTIRKDVLIMNKELEFCLLMEFYLKKKNLNVCYYHDFYEGLHIIETKRPDIIISGLTCTYDQRETLQNKVAALESYNTFIFEIRTDRTSGEGSIAEGIKNYAIFKRQI